MHFLFEDRLFYIDVFFPFLSSPIARMMLSATTIRQHSSADWKLTFPANFVT